MYLVRMHFEGNISNFVLERLNKRTHEMVEDDLIEDNLP